MLITTCLIVLYVTRLMYYHSESEGWSALKALSSMFSYRAGALLGTSWIKMQLWRLWDRFLSFKCEQTTPMTVFNSAPQTLNLTMSVFVIMYIQVQTVHKLKPWCHGLLLVFWYLSVLKLTVAHSFVSLLESNRIWYTAADWQVFMSDSSMQLETRKAACYCVTEVQSWV